MTSMSDVLDVLIIGGGPSGLSTALGLARQFHTAVVFDSGTHDDALEEHMHNFVSWNHQSPAAFRAASRTNILERYDTIQFQDVVIESVRRTPEGLFIARDLESKDWLGRKLVLATGVQEIFPDIDGYADCWAKGIFHSLFFRGFELHGCASAGVLAIGDIAAVGSVLHLARMAKRMTSVVTVYTDGSEELAKQLDPVLVGAGINLDSRRIWRFDKGVMDTEVIMEFEGGESKTEGFLVHKPKTEVKGPFAQQLALELTDEGDIRTRPPFCETSVHGVFAVGDCGTSEKAVAQAIATSTFGTSGLVIQLQADAEKLTTAQTVQSSPKAETGLDYRRSSAKWTGPDQIRSHI
ncbi:MAG: hypothetical protein M1830_001319 [Pleopsidium flavum]|nr:MAG: hypothetical protein M1830_001319 [Pleopsidium flavum]